MMMILNFHLDYFLDFMLIVIIIIIITIGSFTTMEHFIFIKIIVIIIIAIISSFTTMEHFIFIKVVVVIIIITKSTEASLIQVKANFNFLSFINTTVLKSFKQTFSFIKSLRVIVISFKITTIINKRIMNFAIINCTIVTIAIIINCQYHFLFLPHKFFNLHFNHSFFICLDLLFIRDFKTFPLKYFKHYRCSSEVDFCIWLTNSIGFILSLDIVILIVINLAASVRTADYFKTNSQTNKNNCYFIKIIIIIAIRYFSYIIRNY